MLRIGLALVALVALVLVVGFLTPRTHRASVRATYAAPPDSVYRAIADVARGAEWRTGLERVDVVSRQGEPMRWRETADWGTLTMVHEQADPPRRIVSRIVDEGQGFGGTWTYVLTPAGAGTTLVITEDGVVDNPVFRVMSKYVMGHYSALEVYARDLGRRLGDDVEPERVD